MTTTKLPNYFKSQRRRAGLSQADVAFLLGGQGGAHISRYEHFHRAPNLHTALAYEAIFNTSVSELLAGEFEKVERQVANRAIILARRLSNQPPDRSTAKKLVFLHLIAPAGKLLQIR